MRRTRAAAAVVALAVAAVAVWASQTTLSREELLAGARPLPTPYAVPTTPATDALPTVRSGRLDPVRRGERSVPWTLVRLWDGGRRLALQHTDTCDEGARVHVEESARAVVVQVVAGRGGGQRSWRPCDSGARTLVVLDRPLGGRALLQAATSARPPDEQDASLAEVFEDAPAWPGEPWWSGGREVPREELTLAAGPEHCDWQEAVYLAGDALPAPRDERGDLWARDPDGVLDHAPQVRRGFRARATLPPDARPTGYTQGAVQVWTAPSDFPEHVYLVHARDRGDVERWVRGGGGCA